MMHGSTVTKVTHTGRMKRGVGDVGTAAVYVWGGSDPPTPQNRTQGEPRYQNGGRLIRVGEPCNRSPGFKERS